MPENDDQLSPLAAGLTRSELLEIFEALVRARAAEERLELLFKQGHVGGGVYRSLGQEAGSVGSAFALRRRDDGTGDIIAQTVQVEMSDGSRETFRVDEVKALADQ